MHTRLRIVDGLQGARAEARSAHAAGCKGVQRLPQVRAFDARYAQHSTLGLAFPLDGTLLQQQVTDHTTHVTHQSQWQQNRPRVIAGKETYEDIEMQSHRARAEK